MRFPLFFTGIFLFAISTAAGFQLEKLATLSPPYNGYNPQSPIAFALSPTEHIYLLDSRLAIIVEINQQGAVLKQFGGPGTGVEQFNDPADLCVLSGLDVFIADRSNDRIVRLDRELNYLAEYRTLEGTSYDLSFENPQSILLTPRGDLFIADGGNDRILKIDPSGRPIFSFGEYGDARGALLGLVRLELDPREGLWVLDQAGHVIRFDEYGGYILQLQSEYSGMPTGLAISEDAVWVCSDSLIWCYDRNERQSAEYNPNQLSIEAGTTPVDIAFRNQQLWILGSDGAIYRYKIDPAR